MRGALVTCVNIYHRFYMLTSFVLFSGSHSCPQRGCYDCPTYAPGQNPYFKEKHKQAEHVRAKEFMSTGEADKWRKVLEL